MGARNWGWRDVLPYFRGLTCDLDRPAAERNAQAPNIVHRLPREKWPLYMRRIEAALLARGMASHPDVNETSADGFFATPLSQDSERATSARCYLTSEVRARPNLEILTKTRVLNLHVEGNRVCGVVAERGRQDRAVAGLRGRALRRRDQLGGDPAAFRHRAGGGAAAARHCAGRRPSRRRPQLSEPFAAAFRDDARRKLAPGARRPALHDHQPAVLVGPRRLPGGRPVPLFCRAGQQPSVRHPHGDDRGGALRPVLARRRQLAVARSRRAAANLAAAAQRPARRPAHGDRHALRRGAHRRSDLAGAASRKPTFCRAIRRCGWSTAPARSGR